MNYLAHLRLSPPEPDWWVGSLLADFSRGVDLTAFSPAVRKAVTLHFRLDAFTDAHPVVRESKARIRPPHRRYAGVLVDVFYDHFLARLWEDYSEVPLATFASRVYAALAEREALLPERMRRACAAMISDDWLRSYCEVSGIDAALRRMSRRLTRENHLDTGAEALRAEYEALEDDFRRFFPEALRCAADLRLHEFSTPSISP